jgi:hypothetical protein
MRKIRDVLRRRVYGGRSHGEIARSLGLGRATIAEYFRRAEKAEVRWPVTVDLQQGTLDRPLFPEVIPITVPPRPSLDWAAVHREPSGASEQDSLLRPPGSSSRWWCRGVSLSDSPPRGAFLKPRPMGVVLTQAPHGSR